MADEMVAAGAWMVLQPSFDHSGQRVKTMRIDRVTQSHPQRLANAERAFYCQVLVPKSVFTALPNVTIEVPEAAMVAPEVTVG